MQTNEIETLAQLHDVDGRASEAAEVPKPNVNIATEVEASVIKRPNSLWLNCNRNEFLNNGISGEQQLSKKRKHHRYLYRSNSSSLHKRPTTMVPIASASNSKYKLSSELDQIYFISSNKDDDKYDSIDVIDERRMKNLPKSEKARLYKSNTFICEEYYTSAQSQAKCDIERTTTTAPAVNSSENVERNMQTTTTADNEVIE